MSLSGMDSYPGVAKSPEPCKPDYQKMAAELKERMRKLQELYDAIHTSWDILPYDLKKKEFTIFELIGFLDVTLTKSDSEYQSLLVAIEKEKADGSV